MLLAHLCLRAASQHNQIKQTARSRLTKMIKQVKGDGKKNRGKAQWCGHIPIYLYRWDCKIFCLAWNKYLISQIFIDSQHIVNGVWLIESLTVWSQQTFWFCLVSFCGQCTWVESPLLSFFIAYYMQGGNWNIRNYGFHLKCPYSIGTSEVRYPTRC